MTICHIIKIVLNFLYNKTKLYLKRKIMETFEDVILTSIVMIMSFMISNLYKRVKKLEDKISK